MERKPQSPTGPAWLKVLALILACLVSAAIGGGVSRTWGASEYTISYSDFVSIMLTAVSLLITLLAIFLAVLGVIGWTSIEQRVHDKTAAYLAELDGNIGQKVEDAIRSKTSEIMYEGVSPVGEEDDDDASGEVVEEA